MAVACAFAQRAAGTQAATNYDLHPPVAAIIAAWLLCTSAQADCWDAAGDVLLVSSADDLPLFYAVADIVLQGNTLLEGAHAGSGVWVSSKHIAHRCAALRTGAGVLQVLYHTLHATGGLA